MSGPAQPIEWYLARDNKQYGPLSDVELHKLVELRHLREHDLVWRAGFTDWTPAQAVFPQAFSRVAETSAAPREPARPAEPAPARQQAAEPVAVTEPAPAPARAAEPAVTKPQAAAEPAAPVQPAPAPEPAPAPAAVSAPAQQAATPAPAADRLNPAGEPLRQDAHPQAQPAAKIETLAEYRARLGQRLETQSAAGAAPLQPEPSSAHTGAAHLGALRAVPESDQAGAQDRGRAAARRMWIAPADPELGPKSNGAEPQLRIGEPAPHPQAQPAWPQPSLDRGFSPHPAGTSRPADGLGPSLSPQPGFAEPRPRPQAEPQRPGPAFDPRPMPRTPAAAVVPSDYEEDELDEEPPRRPRRIGGLIAILVLLALMVGGTWIAFMQPQLLKQSMRALGLASAGGAEALQGRPSSPVSREQAAATAKPVTTVTLADFPDNPAALGEMLQKGRLWSLVRESFPEWYEERVREAARMVAEKKGDEAVTKHLIDSLVALRRKNADHAFQASLPALEQVARTFRDSLEALTKHSAVACYSLISNGESTRGMVGMFRNPDYGPTLQTGLAAVFAAITDGRSNPNNNLPARRSDYDILTKELQSLGWKEQDINLFSDSEALAKTPPEQVCKMVREWFTAHLAIEDHDIRRRLLIESVKPVVAG